MALNQQSGSKSLSTKIGCKLKDVEQLEKGIKKIESELSFLRKMNQCPLQTGFQGDLEFVFVEDEESIHAHKFVLANKSAVFQNMFEHDMEVKRTGRVVIPDTRASVFRVFLNYLYKAQITFGRNVSPSAIYELARKYDVPELEQVCERMLLLTIDDDNLVEIFEMAQRYESRLLHHAAVQYFKYHFDDVQASVIGHYMSRKT